MLPLVRRPFRRPPSKNPGPAQTVLALLLAVATGCVAAESAVPTPTDRVADAAPALPASPDVVLIMADDLGFSDLGCYGGEIDTPNLDALAARGVRFSQFRVAPMCVVSRVALLSGRPHNGGPVQKYPDTVPFSTLLSEAGYATAISGKWHGGDVDPRRPPVFDRFFGFLGGMNDMYGGDDDWFLNTTPYTDFADDFYATKDLTDHAIRFMQAGRDAGKPNFLFLSYNAPHHPCQAPRATVEKYTERYLAGFRAVRDARVAKQKELGLLPRDWTPAEPGGEVRRWDEMPAERQRVEAGRMAAYAATVDELDQNVGRLLADIEASGRADHTVVMFISDNGGDYSNGGRLIDGRQIAWERGGNPSSSNGWAWVKNTPFRSYKHASFEGALASPLIVRWPAGLATEPGSVVHDATHITDLYPTFLELADADYPATHGGKTLAPLTGASLLPLLTGRPDARDVRPSLSWYNHSSAWVEDGYKAVQLYDGPWGLFDMTEDRTEQHDLADAQPERLAAMVASYNQNAAPKAQRKPPAVAAKAEQRGWGWHRLQASARGTLRGLTPDNGEAGVAADTHLEVALTAPLTASADAGRKIRLFAVADESAPVWEAAAGEGTRSGDGRSLRFDTLPTLTAGAEYFVEWDPAWISVRGKPAGPMNNGAYWWRFRVAE